ncbi:MAG: helix-turn-helix transcriptional regulator [Planctomycetes bacterium]|nr:helix-turn-helix transcriptional regulator [Planctomycetota bacterium]
MGAFPSDLREIHHIGSETREWLVAATASPALREARIQLCGVSAARPGFSFVRRCPEHSQLLLSLSPGGEAVLDGAWCELRPGQGYLTPPGAPHAYRCQPRAEWLAVWAILIEDDDAPRLVTAEVPALIEADARPLHDATLNLHRESVGGSDPQHLRLWSELVAALVRRHLAPVATDQRLWRLWEEVDADLGRPWTLGDLARHAGLGPEQLRRLCLRHLGASPMQHLARLRMRRAAALLATGGRGVATVAAAVGYDNAFAFSTAFRRIMGRPPSRLRPPAGGRRR